MRLTLILLPERLAVCRFAPETPLAHWMWKGSFASVTRTTTELSVVCADLNVPAGVVCERGWRGLQVQGPLDFALIGILTALAEPLAEAGISIFALSTYDTDTLLVRESDLTQAMIVLRRAGHDIRE